MTPLRTTVLAVLIAAAPAALPAYAAPPAASSGFVDGAMFRDLIDETKEVVEVNLEGPILQAIANSSRQDDDDDHDGKHVKADKAIFAKLKSIHAVIGTVKGPSSNALALVQKTDQRLAASGWQRITRITSPESTISVLTHTVGDKVDGLVALIFDSEDKELVFANLAGEIDITQLGEIGEKFNVPGLGALPGVR
jgi:hypothetical protein